jgi:hypothetical protein
MGSPAIVVDQPLVEDALPFGRVSERPSVGALAQERLNESLGLPVGAGPVGPGAKVLEALSSADEPEGRGEISGPVVGEQLTDGDAKSTIVDYSTA